jgi:hypothetical protein
MRATHAGALVCSCLLLAGAGALPGASSDDHLWVIVRTPAPGSRIELRHCAPGTDGPFYTRGLTLAVDDPDAVEAMAAWGNQLWLVFAPTPPAFPTPGEAPRRETFTVQVHRNPALEAWYHVPHDRLRAVASLQGAGTLAGFVGTADGPVAMIVDRMAQGPGLVQLRGPQWQELSLPQGLGPGPWWLGSSGPDGRSLVLLGEPDRPGGPATVHRRDGAGAWSAGEATLGPGRPRSLTRVGGNVALVVERAPQGPVEVAYVRPGVLLRLARLTPPEGRWSVLGTRDGLSLLEQVPEGEVAISTIDPISGTVGQRQVMAPQRLMTVRVLHRPLLMALGITALMVIVLFKPSASASAVVLPPLGCRDAAGLPLPGGGASVVAAVDGRSGGFGALPGDDRPDRRPLHARGAGRRQHDRQETPGGEGRQLRRRAAAGTRNHRPQRAQGDRAADTSASGFCAP